MESLCFIGTESSEPFGKNLKELIRDCDRQRRLRGETRWITILDLSFAMPPARKKVVIGDWYE